MFHQIFARTKRTSVFGCFQLRLLLFWGVNDVCPRPISTRRYAEWGLPAHGLAFEPLPVCKLRCFAHGQLAFVPLPVSRMRHSAHGTRDQSPHRDTSTAPKTCLGMGMISSYVYSCFAGVKRLSIQIYLCVWIKPLVLSCIHLRSGTTVIIYPSCSIVSS